MDNKKITIPEDTFMEELSLFDDEDLSESDEKFYEEWEKSISGGLPKKALSQKQIATNVLATKPKPTLINIEHYVDMEDKMLYAISDMKLFAQKLFYASISEIGGKDTEFKEIVFKASDLAEKFYMQQSNVSKALYEATDDLMSSQLLIWDEVQRNFKQIPIYAYRIVPKNEGIVILKFSEEMKPYLLGLENNFSKAPLEYLLQLSGNAMRLFHIFYGHFYLNCKYPKRKNKKLKILYRQLEAMFEPQMLRNYGRKKKWENPKYPTFREFYRNVLKNVISEINDQGIIHIEMDRLFGKPDYETPEDKKKMYFYETPSDSKNPRKVTHLEFTVTEGSAFAFRERERERKREAKENMAQELKEICEYFKARFDINASEIKKLSKQYSTAELMLAGISMQSILNLSSRGIWVYTGCSGKEPFKWDDLNYRNKVYINEYNKIAIPNLGLFFDENKKVHEFTINKPVGFLKATLEKQKYFETIDVINSEAKLASFGSDIEKLYTKSLYDNKEWGKEFKELVNKKSLDTILIQKIFSFCRDGALKMNTNENWLSYFYKCGNLNLHWKSEFYPQNPEYQEAMNAKIDRILKKRNLA